MSITGKFKGLLLAGIFSASWSIGTAEIQAKTTDSVNQAELSTKVSQIIPELNKERPSIILVNKDLQIIAEFYGDAEVVKGNFQETFKNVGILAEHNGQRVYLLSKN
ncbi:MAG: hypothetical protein ACQEW9_13550 [Bacteroidota bacterium]|uniref:Uncharacterized protein n=1 Tax=Algoriphagus faecimaris TaxID=686796 RepID=A0A1G6WR89_9BACT|nr:hypothetical protein [Algoriphagus faecimaris]SDD68392.1 hypothetical protein SAMN04488104_10472 [Algoriphagus faecimaris]